MKPFLATLPPDGPQSDPFAELNDALPVFQKDLRAFESQLAKQQAIWKKRNTTNEELKKTIEQLGPLTEKSRELIKQADLSYKLATRIIETCEKQCNARKSEAWAGPDITRARKRADAMRSLAVEQLKQVRYFHRQARWLTDRFPEAKLRDMEGLVKLVGIKEIEANDWSLTPGRYVGVAPEEVDEDFDFAETLRDLHLELEDLNTEAVKLAATIKRNFEALGI